MRNLKSKTSSAFFLFMPPLGTYSNTLKEKLLISCIKKYENCFYHNLENCLLLEEKTLKLFKVPKEINKLHSIKTPNLSMQEIRKNGESIIKTFKNIPNTDIFVIGDFYAMKFASLLSLWFLENNLKNKFIAIPCCPFNSVPFTELSAGFLSTLNWCKNIADSFFENINIATQNVAVMEIKGDETGWLTAATAALCSFPNKTLFLTSDFIFDEDLFFIELKKSVEKNLNVIVLVGNQLKIRTGKKIVHHRQNIGTLISKIISKTKIPVSNFQVPTDLLFDQAHISKKDIKISKLYATAAIKFAKKSKGNIMVINRNNFSCKTNLSFEAIPLYDAVTTPRKVPDKFFSKNYSINAALKRSANRAFATM